MEEFGYLTSKEARTLKSDLELQGFEIENLKLQYTNYRVEYGDPIYLRIRYEYPLKLPFMEKQMITMNVERNSVSKR